MLDDRPPWDQPALTVTEPRELTLDRVLPRPRRSPNKSAQNAKTESAANVNALASQTGRTKAKRKLNRDMKHALPTLLSATLSASAFAANTTVEQLNQNMNNLLAGLLILAVIIFLIWLWLLPARLATKYQHPNAATIWNVNLWLGWNLFGWLVCLAWALSNPKEINQ
jgi:hypothetical protein